MPPFFLFSLEEEGHLIVGAACAATVARIPTSAGGVLGKR
jgi:hypothetical protein